MDELITSAQSRFDRTGQWFQLETPELSVLTVEHMRSIESPARVTLARLCSWHESLEQESGPLLDLALIASELCDLEE